MVYALFHEGAFKTLSNFANPEVVTPISASIRKGFTDQESKLVNVFKGPYGFTGKIPPTPPPPFLLLLLLLILIPAIPFPRPPHAMRFALRASPPRAFVADVAVCSGSCSGYKITIINRIGVCSGVADKIPPVPPPPPILLMLLLLILICWHARRLPPCASTAF